MKPPAERKIIVGLILAGWIFVMAVAATYWNTRQYMVIHRGLPQMSEVSRRLQDVLISLAQMGSEEHSFLLTGDAVFIAPQKEALGRIEANLQAIETLTQAPETLEGIRGIRSLLGQCTQDLLRLQEISKG